MSLFFSTPGLPTLIFQVQNSGIAFPPDSPHEEAINLALLRPIERGEYQRLYQKWFGDN